VKIQKKNEETSVQETGNNIRAQGARLLDRISPAYGNLSKISRTINHPDKHERVICIPESVRGSCSSREFPSAFSTNFSQVFRDFYDASRPTSSTYP